MCLSRCQNRSFCEKFLEYAYFWSKGSSVIIVGVLSNAYGYLGEMKISSKREVDNSTKRALFSNYCFKRSLDSASLRVSNLLYSVPSQNLTTIRNEVAQYWFYSLIPVIFTTENGPLWSVTRRRTGWLRWVADYARIKLESVFCNLENFVLIALFCRLLKLSAQVTWALIILRYLIFFSWNSEPI